MKIVKDKYVLFGSFPQKGEEREPIKWRILKREGDVLTLISDVILTAMRYDNEYAFYHRSEIRRYINEEFIPFAFTEEEQAIILPTVLPDAEVCDKVYLPTYDDAIAIPRDERRRKTTAYAVAHEASSYKDRTRLNKCGWWWTRTDFMPPYGTGSHRHVHYVEYNGSVGETAVWSYDIGFVPMMRIKV